MPWPESAHREIPQFGTQDSNDIFLTLNSWLEVCSRQQHDLLAKFYFMSRPTIESVEETPEQMFERAVARHREGALEDAASLYQAILEKRPNHFDSIHNLGAIAVQLDQPASALPLFEAALNADPSRHQYWISYIDALLNANRHDDAREMLSIAQQHGLEGPDVESLHQSILEFTASPAAKVGAVKTDNSGTEKTQPTIPASNRGANRHQKFPRSEEVTSLLNLFHQDRIDEAEQYARLMTERYPEHGISWMVLGATLKQAGRNEDALQAAIRAAQLLPNDVNALSNLGGIQTDLNMLKDSEANLRRAISIDPEHRQSLHNLGATLVKLDRMLEAEEVLRQSLKHEPRNLPALQNLATALRCLEQYSKAEEVYRQAIDIDPNSSELHNALGVTLHQQRRWKDAATCFQRAFELKPDFALALNNLGIVQQRLGFLDAAINSYRQALKIDKTLIDTYINCSSALVQGGQLYEAVDLCEQALRLSSNNPLILTNLGAALQDLGHVRAAGDCFQHALHQKPDFASAMSNLLFNRNYDPDLSPEAVFDTYREYDQRFGFPLRATWKPHLNNRDASRRLKVGYVSPDFRKHSSRHFLEPLLQHHDKDTVEVFAYSELLHEDEVTARYMNLVDHWIPTVGLTDEALAERVRSDGIDILVDLAGHTNGHRLGVFARKPAPVSLTWMGYGNTTGLSAVDYFLTDDIAAPPGSDNLFAEQPFRIANPDIPYRPAEGMGEVSELPALTAGHITFCTLTRRIRINHRTVRAWSEILKRVPDARLVVNSRDFHDTTAKKVLEGEFAAHGIAPDRLQIGCQSPPWDLLRQVDIGLDCFPHNSGTTLLETLYMGVPYITLADRVRVGRIGSSMLHSVGHPEWIAHSEDEYIEKAVALASDLPTLAQFRAGLRSEMQSRPLMNEIDFARRIESAFRQMFQHWANSSTNMPRTNEQQLQDALKLHEAGQLQEAGERYRAILAVDPDHPKANYNFGVLAVQMDHAAAGLPFFLAALDAEPTRAQFWIGYIDALVQAGQLDEARKILAQARQQGLEGEQVDALAACLESAQAVRGSNSASPEAAASNRTPRAIPSLNSSAASSDLASLIALVNAQRFAEAVTLAETVTRRTPDDPKAWMTLGIALNRLGRPADALTPMRRSVELAPGDAHAHSNLGTVYKNLGHLHDAIACYRIALQIAPDFGEAHYNLGNTLKDLSRLDDAVASYRMAARLLPQNALVVGNLGAALHQLGNLREAETQLRRAVQLQSDYADAHFNLGIVLKASGQLKDAEASLQRAALLNPDLLQAHLTLANIYDTSGRLPEAAASLQRALQLKPNDAELHAVLGGVQTRLNRPDAAETSFRRALELNPNLVQALNNLSNVLFQSKHLDEAEELLRRALTIKPDYADAHFNLGNILMERARFAPARDQFKRAVQLDPNHLPAHQNLVIAIAYLSNYEGLVDEANSTLALAPDSPATWEQRLYAFSYHPDLTAEQIFAEFVRWGDLHPVPVADFSGHDRTPGRRLRIGFVSPDFRNHTSRFYFWPMFANHDRTVVELFAYSNVLNEDDATAKFKTAFDHWRNIRGVCGQDVARMIREDRIDILVDGCNHMLDDRLDVFALKPAPIQATWLGAAWTTGLKQVDYVLFDPHIAPEGTLAREKIVRLPHCFIAYQPENQVPTAPTPALKNGYITFGYSGRSERLNHHTFRVWGEILRRIPNSKLILDYRGFADPETQDHYRKFMRRCGMDPNRVVMRCSAKIFEALNDFDVLLDSFPHSAGTMALDGLWMSLPMLTLAGRPPLGRIGTTFMTNIGMTDWIATSHEDYISKAVEHTKDIVALNTVRTSVRSRLLASPIMDGKGFARVVELAYRAMYEEWAHSHAAQPVGIEQRLTRASSLYTAVQHKNHVNKDGAEAGGGSDLSSPQVDHNIASLLSLFRDNRFAEAETLALQLTQRSPQDGIAWNLLGATLKQLGRNNEAHEAAAHAAALLPNDADVHNNLGAILRDLGQLDAAEKSLRQAIQLAPHHAYALSNLGAVLIDTHRLKDAEDFLLKARNIDPALLDAHFNLGVICHRAGRTEEALDHFSHAAELAPTNLTVLDNLGLTLTMLKRHAEAEMAFKKILDISPSRVDAVVSLAGSLSLQGRLSEARQQCERALQLAPDNLVAHSLLGNILQDFGELDQAIDHSEKILRLEPTSQSAAGSRLFCLNYHPDKSGEEIFAAYREFDDTFARPYRKDWKPHTNSRDSGRRLKVGYVSADFKKHSSRHFVEPLLHHHDKNAVEIFAYAELLADDNVTARYKSYVDHWVVTSGLTDDQVADHIRKDGIDILVDLSGHTRGNRLGVFARKPAPISLTWMGYGSTTGLSAIDYFLTDDVAAPPGSERYFSEKPWRVANPDIPFRPAEDMGEPGMLPALRNGHVTFGTLTRRIRINHRTIRVWSEILKRVPQSRLVINSSSFRDRRAIELLAAEFTNHGIERSRLEIGFTSPPWDVLRNVDIGLDCFPHNSGTTLVEMLYMGVPYVTLASRPRVGLIGSSILSGAGHSEWIATSEDEYIKKAIELARDLPALAHVRSRLRTELENGPLMDESSFARRMERAYREMFFHWVQENPK